MRLLLKDCVIEWFFIREMISKSIHPKSYLGLPSSFYKKADPTSFPSLELFSFNDNLADTFGLEKDTFLSPQGLAFLGGQEASIAMAYCGHQFGHWSGLLGDGRARLIGEVENAGLHYELHLKGAGQTPFSRRGDGRATLGSSIREYLVSEAMAALGVPTTRSLCVLLTGERIHRQQTEKGAILCRVARSHVRVGTFEYASTLGVDEVRKLADYSIERLFPDAPADGCQRYAYLLNQVIEKQAQLVAKWMSFGFIHGVMNTDNMTISSETIDYGPCAFMDEFHPQKVFSSIDRNSRYAWNNQPAMAHWNCTRFAETLLPLFGETEADQISIAEKELGQFENLFRKYFHHAMADKFGIPKNEDLESFIIASLEMMTEEGVDFTIFFRQLTALAKGKNGLDAAFNSAWLAKWKKMSLPSLVPKMAEVNPIRIPRNHQIELAIEAANAGDDSVFFRLSAALKYPFEESDGFEGFEDAPQQSEIVHATFCGT